MLNIRTRIKTRILSVTGTVIVLLMLLISFVLLIKWRELIITSESESALSITRTFSVSVIDAIIFEEQSLYRKENVLETYVQNFMTRLGTVHYVVIADSTDAPIVQVSNDAAWDPSRPLVDATTAERGDALAMDAGPAVHIIEHAAFGWTMEVHQPLVFFGTRWGTVVIGFDAQPIRDEIRSVFILLLVSTVVITTVVLVILFLLINRMTRSIEELVRAIDSIDFRSTARVDLAAREDEIGYFFHHFSLLQDRVEAARRDLEMAQRQIYQAEKLASIGRLAAGVAHQVNNPLNGIKSCLYAIERAPGNTERTAEYLQLIGEGIDDIETVVRKLLGFARQQSTSESRISINEAIGKVLSLFELRLKEKNIEVRTALDEAVHPVRIDSHLFQEVVMNLVLNSYDAIERDGVIAITTGNVDASTVLMEIRDTGTGIEPAVLAHIFDPFFTTKDVGTGTGLGLSVCMGIIESHGGHIDVVSRPHTETMFRITLPRDEDETPDY